MKIEVVCVGKLKEKYLVEAIKEYTKRLGRYCKLNIVELSDEKTPDNASEKEELMIKDKEGEKILSHIKDGAYVIALALDGKMISSEELASFVADCGVKGNSHLVFVIGGSLGLSEAVLKRANYKLCFSKMTFPHQLFRVMLLEQIYRAYRINNGEPYHK
ncbi:MAG: 23S rRNA (pseudouridine(1915)-N(3))-methyltransferase RlmH [Cellulosilyticaceae bacterium]